jgi:hypothetical protein
MNLVVAVGGARVGIVHGDAESLSGWRFAHDSLHDSANVEWLRKICGDANLTGFASSHTCLPTFRRFTNDSKRVFVANNGASGMPNFGGTEYGLITRLSVHPTAEGAAQYGDHFDGLYVDALPVHYDSHAFKRAFDAQWPAESAASISYRSRIFNGPSYAPPHALGLVRAPSVCA